MGNITIAATERTPEVDFNFDTHSFSLRGESYPEDINEFYGPIMVQLTDYLKVVRDTNIHFSVELIYFNSSSAKILMSLFDLLDEAAQAGNKVHISWIFEEDDDNMQELGEEFCEILEHASYKLIPIEAS